MARQLRVESEGAFYHITPRGNRREKIYFEDGDRERSGAWQIVTASCRPDHCVTFSLPSLF